MEMQEFLCEIEMLLVGFYQQFCLTYTMLRIIEATTTTPFVKIDPQYGLIEIRGKSGPERATHFYTPIVEQIRDLEGSDQFTLILFMEYFNTSSAKCLFDLIKATEGLSITGTKSKVIWYIEEDDDDMRDTAADYEDLVSVEFECIPVDEDDFIVRMNEG